MKKSEKKKKIGKDKSEVTKLIAGADEAGRGCLIGSLVISLTIIKKRNEKDLRRTGVKDSKILSPSTRERIAKEIEKICEIYTIKITARELNTLMKHYSLNAIEAMKIAELISKVGERKLNSIEKIYVDSPDSIPKKFTDRISYYSSQKLRKLLKNKIHSANKADVRFPICSAASVIAKVTRDDQIKKIKHEIGEDFGSGYTSDQVTINFLEKNFENKSLQKYLRVRWKTFQEMKKKLEFGVKQIKLEDFW